MTGDDTQLSEAPTNDRITPLKGQLTEDIAVGFANELNVETVLVKLSTTHLCEAMREIETPTQTATRAIVGTPMSADRRQFRDSIARAEWQQ